MMANQDHDVAPETAAGPAEASANGTAGAEPRRGPDERQGRFAQSFSQILAVLMRDTQFRNMRLADLEWLVLPPLLAGQVRVAHAPSGRDKFYVPVAVAVWARVSPEVDRRLAAELDKPMVLRPAEWTSGDQVWLVALAGEANAKATFLPRLAQEQFKGMSVKMRGLDRENRVVVTTLDQIGGGGGA